jgi:UDP-GlcNAc:undecaprenyl-phosphate GlcNAc-1-phosphate transferase
LLGLVGIAALWWGIPESMMFAGFLLTFAVYFYIIARPWRFVPALRRLNEALGLPSAQARGIYIGYLRHQDARMLLDILTAELADLHEYHLSLHEMDGQKQDSHLVYGILELPLDNADASLGEIKSLIDKLRTRLTNWPGLQVRPFLQRNSENDRRAGIRPTAHTNNRSSDRRAQQTKPPMQTLRHTEVKAPRHNALPV